MKSKISKAISILMVLVMFSCLSMNIFAASKNTALKAVKYNYMTGKSAVVTNTFKNVPNNEKITIKTGWGNSFKSVTSKNTGGLKSYADKVRFDAHIIDTTTNRIVKSYCYLKSGSSFKVFSEIPSIKAKKYDVRIVSYFNDYKTFVGNAKVGWQYGNVAANLKYKITY